MNKKYILSVAAGALLTLSSCTKDLDVMPLDPNVMTAEKAYASSEDAYLRGLNKIYSIWAMSGQDGEGSSDIKGLDAGNCQLMRSWWNLNEVCTDEAKNAWGDDWVTAVNSITWNTMQNEAIEGAYQRSMFIVALANEYITQVSKANFAEQPQYIAEARFCRALAYSVLLDLFRNPPFITESNYSNSPAPVGDREKGINPTLFNWIVTELNECKANLPAAGKGVYGHADQGAADFLLARLYLNAEIYAGENHYTDCVEACKRVIAGGYSLSAKYENLFMADNDQTCKNEIIFPIVYDGAATKTWGGMTFLIMASVGGKETDMKEYKGVNSGWDGMRPTGQFIDIFEFDDDANPTAATVKDKRLLCSDKGIGEDPETKEVKEYDRKQHIVTTPKATFAQEGWEITKFRNQTSTGLVNDDAWPDTDFPMFRLADVYLMYAEAVLRGGTGGDTGTAVGYINNLRKRGYTGTTGNISQADMTLDFILDERARELYWEGTRRTDLIRFGKFTKGYNWDFKGGVNTGTNVEDYYIIYPIPATDLTVNPNLKQNKGYVNEE